MVLLGVEVPVEPVPVPFMSVPVVLVPVVGVPPTVVAAESVPSVLLGVLVLVVVSLWLLPQLLSEMPPNSTAARGKEVLKKRIKQRL